MKKQVSKPMTKAQMAAEAERDTAARMRAQTEAVLNEGLRGPLPVGHIWNDSVGYVAVNQAPVRGPESWPGGYWAKSGPGSYDRGGSWNN